VESEAMTMATDQFGNVEIGIVATVGTLRGVLKAISVAGRRWWIACDPRDALENGAVTVGFGDPHCSDPLNTIYFRIPIIGGVQACSTDRLLMLFDPSVIEAVEPGYFLERGRFVRDCVGDFERFFFPIKAELSNRIRLAGPDSRFSDEGRATP
jgi:hypothetical protein